MTFARIEIRRIRHSSRGSLPDAKAPRPPNTVSPSASLLSLVTLPTLPTTATRLLSPSSPSPTPTCPSYPSALHTIVACKRFAGIVIFAGTAFLKQQPTAHPLSHRSARRSHPTPPPWRLQSSTNHLRVAMRLLPPVLAHQPTAIASASPPHRPARDASLMPSRLASGVLDEPLARAHLVRTHPGDPIRIDNTDARNADMYSQAA